MKQTSQPGIRNWKEYNSSLVTRGRVTIWLDSEVIASWGNVVVMDSTGFKVYGEGEWKVRKHGWSKRRTWRKLHLGVNESSLEIVAAQDTGNNTADKEVSLSLLESFDEPVDQVSGARATIPPQRNARVRQKDPRLRQRNENIRRIRELATVFEDEEEGRKRWKQETAYHRRSLAETTMMRLKTISGHT